MKKRLEFEIESLPHLQAFANTLKETIPNPIHVKQDAEGNSIRISTEHQELHIQIFPLLKEDLTESYLVEALTPTEGFDALLCDLLGPPKKATRIMPSILDFANAVLQVSKTTWEAEVSRNLALSESDLERFVRALADAASMKGAPPPIVEATRRLSLL